MSYLSYNMNAINVEAHLEAPTSQNIDTNGEKARLIADHGLELCMRCILPVYIIERRDSR